MLCVIDNYTTQSSKDEISFHMLVTVCQSMNIIMSDHHQNRSSSRSIIYDSFTHIHFPSPPIIADVHVRNKASLAVLTTASGCFNREMLDYGVVNPGGAVTAGVPAGRPPNMCIEYYMSVKTPAASSAT